MKNIDLKKSTTPGSINLTYNPRLREDVSEFQINHGLSALASLEGDHVANKRFTRKKTTNI